MQVTGSAYLPLQTSGYLSPNAAPAGQAEQKRSGTPAPIDRVELSATALQSSTSPQTSALAVSEARSTTDVQECAECAAGICKTCGDQSLQAGTADPGELSEDQQAQVKELKERDAEVRAHEAAHAATGGSYAGAPSYEYQVGPDGKRYAVGGEVSIDTSPIDGDPQATINKLQQVQAAALAPAEPSDQDRKVAAQAAAALREAQSELAAEKQADLQDQVGPTPQASKADGNPPDELASAGQQPTAPGADREGNARSPASDTPLEPAIQQQIQQAATAYQRISTLA